MFGWLMCVHQIGGATAAFLAGLLRMELGTYLQAFMLSGLMCLLAAVIVLLIGSSRGRPREDPRRRRRDRPPGSHAARLLRKAAIPGIGRVDDPGRIAGDQAMVRDGFPHDGTGRDHAIATDLQLGQDDRALPRRRPRGRSAHFHRSVAPGPIAAKSPISTWCPMLALRLTNTCSPIFAAPPITAPALT